MSKPDIDLDRIDDAVLALMHLTLHDKNKYSGLVRAWKSLDWDAMNRLREGPDLRSRGQSQVGGVDRGRHAAQRSTILRAVR